MKSYLLSFYCTTEYSKDVEIEFEAVSDEEAQEYAFNKYVVGNEGLIDGIDLSGEDTYYTFCYSDCQWTGSTAV